MATTYYSLNDGQHTDDVVLASAAPVADVVVSVNTANVPSKASLLIKLEYIRDAIIKGVYPFT